jgi:signal peptidase I
VHSNQPTSEVAREGKDSAEHWWWARRKGKAALAEWVILFLIAGVMALGLRAYGVQAFSIPSGSMEPTLQPGDHILVNKLSSRFGSINIGDIIVFRAPTTVQAACGDPHYYPYLIKRVIGVPGDRLRSVGNTIYVDGKVLHQKWPHINPVDPPIKSVTVGVGEYFVMGDNHADSCDSRFWGMVPRSAIVGKAFVRIWPAPRIGWL